MLEIMEVSITLSTLWCTYNSLPWGWCVSLTMLYQWIEWYQKITDTKISESTYSVFLFSMAFGWGPPWRSFLTSTASALTMRSIWEVQGASHDPGGGVDTTAVLAGNSNLYLSEIFSPVLQTFSNPVWIVLSNWIFWHSLIWRNFFRFNRLN